MIKCRIICVIKQSNSDANAVIRPFEHKDKICVETVTVFAVKAGGKFFSINNLVNQDSTVDSFISLTRSNINTKISKTGQKVEDSLHKNYTER